MTPRFTLQSDSFRRCCRLLPSLLCLALASPLTAAERPSLELVEASFFEGNGIAEPPEWGSPQLAESFDRAQARYIYTLVNLKNNLWQLEAQDVRLRLRYFAPDGSLIGEPQIDYRVPVDWEYADLWTGWGWDDTHQWEAGVYKVEIHRGDDESGNPLAVRQFQITDNSSPAVTLSRGSVAYDRMGFFTGDNVEDEPPDDWSDPRLRNRFAQDAATFVYTLVSLKNLQWQQRGQRIVIYLRYYRSSGELAGDPVIDYQVPADWETVRLVNGWGWPEPGKWERDRYRVELWLNNRRKIGESHFEIY